MLVPLTQPTIHKVTLAALRAEGILEVGCAKESSVLFVLTRVKLHLLHSTGLPDRQLDGYAVHLAVTWIEDQGLPSYEVAKNLGVNVTTLRSALTAAGYARLSQEQHNHLVRARAARKIGNRRGRLVRASEGTCLGKPEGLAGSACTHLDETALSRTRSER